ncbi:MAG: GDP-mannose 4,6-dehydratase, partial [Bacteroidota bacterium]|nr:GDP-mannose 4,6-dehydratase [Bacteroidota bacterium]
CVRDYIHVMDLAQAHVRALEWMSDPIRNYEVFNVGTGTGESVLQVVRTFEKVNGVKVPYTIGPRRAGDVISVYAHTEKCNSVLGWRPVRGLEDALRDAWRWQQELMKDPTQTATSQNTQK